MVRQEPSARHHNRKGGDHGPSAGPASPQRPLHRTGWPLSQRKDDTSRSDTGAHRRHHPPRFDGGRQYRGRRLGGGAASRHERRAQRRHRRFPRRQLHLPRLSGLDRIPGRCGERAHGLRRRRRGVRARREEGAGAPAHPQAARGSRHSAFPVHQQDRQGRGAGARHRADASAGLDQAAGAAADPDLGERHRHRLHRSRARARPCLSRACAERGDRHSRDAGRAREGSPLLHAGEARRLRRRADGAIARRRAAAARQGVRRSLQGAARRGDLPGAARLGGKRPRHLSSAEGVEARSPFCANDC